LQQRSLDGIELDELARTEVQFAPHVDEWRHWIAADFAAASAHSSATSRLSVHRDRHRHRNGEYGGASQVLLHGRSILHGAFSCYGMFRHGVGLG
jgi:hypothetical protein